MFLEMESDKYGEDRGYGKNSSDIFSIYVV